MCADVLMNERDLNVLMIKTCSRASVAREIDDATCTPYSHVVSCEEVANMDAYDSLSSVNHWQKYWTRWRLRLRISSIDPFQA